MLFVSTEPIRVRRERRGRIYILDGVRGSFATDSVLRAVGISGLLETLAAAVVNQRGSALCRPPSSVLS